MSKSLHWTQRPENKEKLKASHRKAVRSKKAARTVVSTPTTQTSVTTVPEDTFAYALGFVECWIQTYASSAGVSSEALASRMGKVLQGKSSR